MHLREILAPTSRLHSPFQNPPNVEFVALWAKGHKFEPMSTREIIESWGRRRGLMPCRSRTSFNSHPYPVGADVVAHALRIAVAPLCDDRVSGVPLDRQHHRAPRCCAASADPQVQRHRLSIPSWLLTLDCQPHGVVVQVVIVATTRARIILRGGRCMSGRAQ